MENILVIAHHLLPYTPSYGQIARHLTLINQLTKYYKVHIITIRGKREFGNFGFELNKNIIVHYVADPNYFPDEKTIIPQGNYKISKLFYAIQNYGIKIIIGLLLKSIKNIFILDKYEYPAINNFFQGTVNIIENTDVSKILIMTPPYSFHKLAAMIKKKYKYIPMLIDVQDSFVIPALLKGNSISSIRSRNWEKKSVMNADKVVFNIPIMKKKYDDYYKISEKSDLIFNGYDSNQQKLNKINNSDLSDQKLNIGYFGKIHIGNNDYFRDIRKLFEFFKRKDDKFKQKFQLDIYGYFSGNYEYWQASVPFIYHGQIDSNKVASHMVHYDALLLFHSEKSRAEEVLTGKLFEYVFAKKPIISLGPKNMISAKDFIEKNKLGLFIDIDDNNDIENKISHLYDLKMENNLNSIFNKEFDISQFDRRILNKEYIKLISRLGN